LHYAAIAFSMCQIAEERHADQRVYTGNAGRGQRQPDRYGTMRENRPFRRTSENSALSSAASVRYTSHRCVNVGSHECESQQ
jgi:hypothetical protein